MIKKITFLFVFVFICMSSSQAYNTYRIALPSGSNQKKNSGVTTSCKVTASSDSKNITIEYTIPFAKITTDSITELSSLEIDKFNTIVDENTPAVVARGDCFEIPDGYEIELLLDKCEYTDLCIKLKATDSIDKTTGDYICSKVEATTNGFFPQQPVSLAEKIIYRGHTIQYINVTPALYNSSTSTTRIYHKITYRINLIPSRLTNKSKKFQAVSQTPEEDASFLSSILTYCPQTPIVKEPRAAQMIIAPDLIIVTHPNLEPAVNKYAEWKKVTGLNVKIFSEYNWTSDEIKSQLYEYYQTCYPLGLLIVGSADLVPTNKINSNVFSDMPYACADGENDFYPDLIYSRIPAVTNSEADEIFKKLMRYDRYGLSEESMYNKVIGVSSFIDGEDDAKKIENNTFVYDRNGIEDYGYTRNIESIGKYLESLDLQFIRQYYCAPDTYPKSFNNGEEIPEYLQKPDFPWNADPESIRNEIDKGVNLVLF